MAISLNSPPKSFPWTEQWKKWANSLYEWVAGTQWYTPTLQNNWVDYGGSYQGARYRKISGTVELQGLIKSGTTTDGTTILTLPEGFRPAKNIIFCSLQAGGNSIYIEVQSDGVVYIYYVTNNSWISLSGLFFKAEQ